MPGRKVVLTGIGPVTPIGIGVGNFFLQPGARDPKQIIAEVKDGFYVTELLGFRPGAEEHKVQWLSTFGDDRHLPLFREVVSDNARLDASYFDGRTGRGEHARDGPPDAGAGARHYGNIAKGL